MSRRGFNNMNIGWKIVTIVLGVIVALGLLFLAYCGLSALFTGNGFVDTMSDTWCTIFGLVKETTDVVIDTTEEVLPEVNSLL